MTPVLAACLALTGLAQAQTTPPPPRPPQRLERVDITGSSIKAPGWRESPARPDPQARGHREDRRHHGGRGCSRPSPPPPRPLSDGMSITDGTSGQRGFNGANLRGIGVSLHADPAQWPPHGNFASPGDNAGVDLNNIPAGAIQRVKS